MQADQITTYLPFVELMDRVETTKVLWILTILLLGAMIRIYFLNARVRKLEGREPETTATGWVRPTRKMVPEVSTRVMRSAIYDKHAYPDGALCEIHPWSTESIAVLTMYMRQSVSLEEIALQRRIVTVSAIVYGFAIPAEMLLLDQGAIAMYCDYRARINPVLGSVELMQYAHVGDDSLVEAAELDRLTEAVVPIVGAMLKFAEKEAWPVFDAFYRDLRTGHVIGPIDPSQIKSIITAYSAYAKMLVPAEYVLNNATAFCLYRRISTMALFEPIEQQA